MTPTKPSTAKENRLYLCPSCRHEAELFRKGGFDAIVGGGFYYCPKCNHSVMPIPVKRKAAKPLKQRISRQRRKRLDKDAEYLATRDIHLENNPDCPECGRPATRFHHFCNAADKGTSLTNTDMGMGGCEKHGAAWDNKGDYPMARQFAMKFKSMLKRYREITGKCVAVDDVIKELKT